MSKLRLSLYGIALSIISLFAVGGMSRMDDSAVAVRMADLLSLPGAVIASIFFPEGLHTGGGAAAWAWTVVASNFFFYAIVWMVLIKIVRKFKMSR